MKSKLKERRKALKMSQQALAKESGVSRTTISLIESNKGVVIKTSTMEKIADALQTTVMELFFENIVKHVEQN